MNYCSRIAGASHKNVISDIIPICLEYDIDENNEKFKNFLISSSWDGTVKIWKWNGILFLFVSYIINFYI